MIICKSTSQRKKRNLRLVGGFTLIEVLVSVAITVLITGSLIVYGSASRKFVALTVEEAKIAQQILKAKSLSVTTRRSSAGAAFCGYGWHIDYAARSYFIYRYEGADCSVIDPADPAYLRNVIERSELNENLVFSQLITAEGGGGPGPLLDVLFVPPEPKTIILSGVDPESATQLTGFDRATITLRTRGGGPTGIITVTTAGQVTF